MIADRRILAIVPARGGSKGLPGKNVRSFLGKPLIAWTLEAASNSRYVDQIAVSTDDDAIAEAAASAGFPPPFRRPDSLAGDKASVVDAVVHVLETLGERWDYVILLQPTSPLRRAADIDAAIERCHSTGAPAVVTVSPLSKPANFLCAVGPNGALDRFESEADRDLMMLNGAVYVVRTDILMEQRKFTPEGTLAHVTPFERAWDIDSLYDFVACEALAPHLLFGDDTMISAVRR